MKTLVLKSNVFQAHYFSTPITAECSKFSKYCFFLKQRKLVFSYVLTETKLTPSNKQNNVVLGNKNVLRKLIINFIVTKKYIFLNTL